MNIAAYLANAAKAFADRPAISIGNRTVYTYRQLYGRVVRLRRDCARYRASRSAIGSPWS